MPCARKQVSNAPKSIRKNARKKDQLHSTISLRISNNQKMMLEKLSKATSKSVSDIMREAVNIWSSKRRNLCLD